MGELVVAYLRPRESGVDLQALATELDAFCKDSVALADYKRPRRYAIVDELPYTATGKKQHFVMKQRATHDAAAGLFVTP
ncbi:AMP-binding enzyme [Pseudolysinimonas kribbensis]|uniref:AMP-binding enzyme n=1 Tax=Pseudolysinimonas kribbensis TaxID=433641 RepID=UPI0024E10689|nr:hypothetical protein [Pseudolysinimonas kribbensis]